ncbi:MAG TPA: NAD-glutamate dehydrogenase domain-containing protein, partial [Nevskiaceae bacterium]|nr:NAD-glutamate dehydrogenase domain-containing protein [Nevskiaceae bacterium]
IKLSAEAQVALGTEAKSATPAELMRIILQAPVDLLWNGGIGTYVKASHQGHDAARDRANDMLRVDGRDVRARVVGEGGNLGFTQAGRIEYARRGGPTGAGGRINTDAIDNSGGVHSSDREVNLKIPLNQLMKEEGLSREDRDRLLVAMTDDIARFVLRDNYVQSAAISLVEAQAAARVDEHAALIRRLEREGLLDRALEGLPDDEELQERRSEGIGLTRPEIAVLVAYAKISLKRTALSSDLSDDPSFVRDLLANFPPAMVEQHRVALTKHRLRREIIATILANAVVNRMGASFAHRLADDHGVPHDEVLAAYAASHELFGGDRYWAELEALDGRIPSRLQYRLMEHAAALLKHATGWIIGARLYPASTVGEIVARYLAAVPQVEAWIPAILPPSYREDFDRHLAGLRKDNVPEDVAVRIVRTKALGCALDLADLAELGKVTLAESAEVYFQVGERLRMPWLHGAIVGLRVSGHWQALARSRLRDDAYRLHGLIAASALVQSMSPAAERLGEWLKRHERRVVFSLGRLQELQTTGAADYASLAVAVRELHDLHVLQSVPAPKP